MTGYPGALRVAILAAAILAGCGDPPDSSPQKDATSEPGYRQSVEQLAGMNHEAEEFFRSGKSAEAAALIERGEPLASQLLDVPRPTLAAMEASSDLDDLYGRMLLSNRHYEWAQFQFQKNRARWKYWKPETPETDRRMKVAESEIAECDRGMMKGTSAPRGRAQPR